MTAPLTDSERAFARMLIAWLEWVPTLRATRPDAILRSFSRDLVFQDFAESERQALTEKGAALVARYRAEVSPPVERTPEVVLRAMLAAYEVAALAAVMAYVREGTDAAWGRRSDAEGLVDDLRVALAHFLVRGNVSFVDDALEADYLARLAGTTPLDAPPAVSS